MSFVAFLAFVALREVGGEVGSVVKNSDWALMSGFDWVVRTAYRAWITGCLKLKNRKTSHCAG